MIKKLWKSLLKNIKLTATHVNNKVTIRIYYKGEVIHKISFFIS